MKKIISVLSLICLLFTNKSFAQNSFIGSWEGQVERVNLRLAFHFEKSTDGKLSAKMDSPDQQAFNIPMDTVSINANVITTSFSRAGLTFTGSLINDSTIEGKLVQGAALSLTLKRKVASVVAVSSEKPQTPIAPFAYKTEDVKFNSTAPGVQMAGIISRPTADKKYPAVILISGSGPQNRDEQLGSHKPFAVIADFLTKKGFLVLRYDDRGVGESNGDFNTATSLDFSKDAAGAVQYLLTRNDVDTKQIGLIGHSEGGMIAPMVAQKEPVAFMILLAGPGIPIIDLMTEQNIAFLKSQGTKEATAIAYGRLYKSMVSLILTHKDKRTLQSELESLIYKTPELPQILNQEMVQAETVSMMASEMIKAIDTDWFKFFLTYEPKSNLNGLKIPVLALNGEKDIQVLPTSNLKGIKDALNNGNSKSEFVELPGQNHLFQVCKLCTVKEYFELDETFSPIALEIMSQWLSKIIK